MILYDEFCEKLKNTLKCLPTISEKYDMAYERVFKTNCYRDALIFKNKESLSNVTCITLYFEDMYKCYKAGKSLDSIAAYIEHLIIEHEKEKSYKIDMEKILSCVRENVCLELINTKQNEELLKTIPHENFLDMSIVCRMYIPEELVSNNGTILVTDNLLNHVGITKDEIFSLAKENTLRMKDFNIQSIRNILLNVAKETEKEDLADLLDFSDELFAPLYVATSKDHLKGASIILYNDILSKFAEKLGDDLYIIPSSIHEVLFCAVKSVSLDNLEEIVPQINVQQVDLQDRLSNQVYYFDRKTREISIVTKNKESLKDSEEDLELD